MAEWKWVQQIEHQHTGSGEVECRLRWTERQSGVASGLWQVTYLEPSLSTVNWQNPPGLIASGKILLAGRGNHDEFVVRFTPRRGPARLKRPASHAAGVYYVRVMGLDRAGKPAGWPSNAVTINYTPLQLAPTPPPDPIKSVKFRRVHFEPIQPRDPNAHQWYVVTRDIQVGLIWYTRGQILHLVPKDDDDTWLEGILEAVGSGGDSLINAVNWVSDAYEDLKGSLVSFVAASLPCPDPEICRAALDAALDYGLASMGIPPSIPNFDQMVDMGKGYLVETMVAEVYSQTHIPIPPEVVEAAVDELVKRSKHVADHGPSGTEWLKPDPARQFQPARIEIDIVNEGQTASPGREFRVEHPLFVDEWVYLPPLSPGRALRMPVLLKQNFQGYAKVIRERHPEKRSAFLSDGEIAPYWWDAYRNETLELKLSGLGNSVKLGLKAVDGITVWQPQ